MTKAGRHDPDDFVREFVEGDGLTDDGGVGGVALQPQIMAEDDGAMVAGCKGTAEGRRDAQRLEEIGRYLGTGDAFGPVFTSEVKGSRAIVGGIIGRLGVGAHHVERATHTEAGGIIEPGGIGKGKRAKEYGVKQAENG